MDIKEIDLRRSDFEAMHPVAKLFNFDHEKLTYFGDAYDDARRLNDLWSTWCACVGLLYLETNTAKAQAVPEGFLLMPRKCTNKMAHAAKAVDGRLSAFKYADVYDAMIEAQEPTND
ncbi:MAG: hypothetical protein RRZ32_00445 [Acinetobacter sp.]